MKWFSILLTVSILSSTACAQAEVDSIKSVINKLFEGMKYANAEMIRNSFADSAILQTIVFDKTKGTMVKNENVSEFAEFISKTVAGEADEKITFETVKIDGPLAVVWTPYLFYYKGNFSHCGVNSFQMVRINNKWKIQYLIDTRRKSGCGIAK